MNIAWTCLLETFILEMYSIVLASAWTCCLETHVVYLNNRVESLKDVLYNSFEGIFVTSNSKQEHW